MNGRFRRRFWWWLMGMLLFMCNLPLTPVAGGGPSAGTYATMTALFAQVPTLIPTVLATATPVEPVTPGATPTLPPPPGPLREGGTVAARRRSAPPTLDGRLDDWPELPYRADKVVWGPDHWSGPEDLSARFAVAWDDAGLYLAAQVTDDVYAQTARGFNLFKGDALEILIDRDLYGDFATAALNDDDYHLGLSPGIGAPGNQPEAFLWFPKGLRGPRSQVQIAARSTGQGGSYAVEAFVPWEVLGSPLSPGVYTGFAFRVSDNDLPGQAVQQSMVASVGPPHVYNNPTTWGNLVLVP